MALEPRTITLAEEENHKLKDMRRRFWESVVLTVPLFLIGMSALIPGAPCHRIDAPASLSWLQAALASPVVLWGGWPFFVRAWHSFRSWNLNMYSLIALGTGAAYAFSVYAILFPETLPPAFKHDGNVPLYFESAAVITVLVLLGEVLQLRARSRSSGAIKALLGLTPGTATRVTADGTEE